MTGFKTKAWVRALDVAVTTDPAELEERARAGTLTELPGIGDSTARVIREAIDGEVPAYLTKLEAETVIEMSPEAAALPGRAPGRLPHPLHVERRRAPASRTMAATAIAPRPRVHGAHRPLARLTIAHGLDRERLLAQLDDLAALNERLAPFRILTGMEVDILEDGQLDLDDELLARLDVVVASVHSKLRMERPLMTQRMVLAVASPARRHPRPLHRPADRQAPAVGVRRRLRVRGVRPLRHRGRDQQPPRAARPAEGAARPRPVVRLLHLDRLRRPRHRAARVAAARLRQGGRRARSRSSGSINTWPIDDLLAWTETSEAA